MKVNEIYILCSDLAISQVWSRLPGSGQFFYSLFKIEDTDCENLRTIHARVIL